MSKKEIDPFGGRPLCGAPTKNGWTCKKHALPNRTRCASHGGNIPAVIAAAHTRGMMAADRFMAKLQEIAFDDSQPPAVQLEAIKQGLIHAGFSGKQQIELTVEKGKTFDDVLEGVLIDIDEDEEGRPDYSVPTADSNVVDAEVVEDVEDEPVRNRRDAAAFREVDRAERKRIAPKRQRPTLSDAERAAQERDLLAQTPPEPETLASKLDREQYLLARDRGANFSSRGMGRPIGEGEGDGDGGRRARSSRADLG